MMARRHLSIVLAILGAFLFIAGNAMALPSPPSGFKLSGGMDFWSPTDFTSNNSLFQLEVEEAGYESEFGLYTVDDLNNPTAWQKKFTVFEAGQEPGMLEESKSTITFWEDGGNWKITDSLNEDEDGDYSNDDWTNFDSHFGFYYDVYTNGQLNYSFYTANNLNSEDAGIEHIYTAYNHDDKQVYIYLEDLLAKNADWDWNDMTVFADDVEPVPEPATMLLFGTGLVGLAGFTRRRLKEKKS